MSDSLTNLWKNGQKWNRTIIFRNLRAGLEMAGRQSLITQSGILSFPGYLLFAMDLTIFSTWLIFTLASKKNCSDTGYSRGTNELTCASHWNCSAKVLIFWILSLPKLTKRLLNSLATMFYVLWEDLWEGDFFEMQLRIAFHMIVVLFLLHLICCAKNSFSTKRVCCFTSWHRLL